MNKPDPLKSSSDELARLAPHIKESLDRYLINGIPTGGFLRAVLANDLFVAVGTADDNNIVLLPLIIKYIYNNFSRTRWGSYAIVDTWLKTNSIAKRKLDFLKELNNSAPAYSTPPDNDTGYKCLKCNKLFKYRQVFYCIYSSGKHDIICSSCLNPDWKKNAKYLTAEW